MRLRCSLSGTDLDVWTEEKVRSAAECMDVLGERHLCA